MYIQAKLYIFSELNSLFSEDSNVGCFLGSVTSHLFSILGSHHLYLFSIVSIHSTSFKIRKNYWLMYIVGKCSIMIPSKGVRVTINHNVLYIHDEILAHCTGHEQPKIKFYRYVHICLYPSYLGLFMDVNLDKRS